MEWTVTLAVTGLGLALAVFAAWKSGRPRKDSHRPRWISWQFLTVLAGAVAILALVHALNLLGLNTGRGSYGSPF